MTAKPMSDERLAELRSRADWREFRGDPLTLELLAEIDSLRNVLADRERELFEVKGSCRNRTCSLHYAHYGPCALVPVDAP